MTHEPVHQNLSAGALEHLSTCLRLSRGYFAVTLRFLRPSSSAPRETVTVTFQVQPIAS